MQIGDRMEFEAMERTNRSWISCRLTALTLAVGLLTACSNGAADGELPNEYASIDGEPVTRDDVREAAGAELDQLESRYRQQRHEILQTATRKAVRMHLLRRAAEARGIDVEELIAEKTAQAGEVTDEDVVAWYQLNRSALGGAQLEDLEPRIREFLRQQREERVIEEFTSELEQEHEVRILLEPFRVELDNDGAPSLGPEDAPVTLVEFSDFECPYCGRFYRTLKRLQEEFGDSLRVVYRHFPLPTHPHAQQAARASMCAADQGRFWEMHDVLFEGQDELTQTALREKAERSGLDVEEYDACMADDRHDSRIAQDVREGERVGIDGTPAVFLNGIKVPGGAASYNVVAEMIEEEIARKTRG